MEEEENIPRDKCLQAARAILDLVHRLSATAYDPSLLPRTIIALWDCAAGIFGLFYRRAVIRGDTEEAKMYRSEIEVFRCVRCPVLPLLSTASSQFLRYIRPANTFHTQ